MEASATLHPLRSTVAAYDGRHPDMFLIYAGAQLAAAQRCVVPTPAVRGAEAATFNAIRRLVEDWRPADAGDDPNGASRREALALLNRLEMAMRSAKPSPRYAFQTAV